MKDVEKEPGVLVVDKPQGPTSHDVVSIARRALGERRIGHCGTLDPMATGVLVMAVGVATRLVRYLSSDEKQYDAEVRFGLETDTWDVTGEVRRTSDARPSREAIEDALSRFRGPFLQTPPAFSAKKVAGRRAYDLARSEAPVELKPVPVEARALALTGFDGTTAHLTMRVSAGFYVRSLAQELGAALGMGAALERLRRTASGRFTLAQALDFDLLATGCRDEIVAGMAPLASLLPERPFLRLSAEQAASVRHGRDVEAGNVDWTGQSPDGEIVVRLLGPDGSLVAIAGPGALPGFLHPSVVLG